MQYFVANKNNKTLSDSTSSGSGSDEHFFEEKSFTGEANNYTLMRNKTAITPQPHNIISTPPKKKLTSEELYCYLRHTAKLLATSRVKIDNPTFIQEYRNYKLPIQKTFGYKGNKWFKDSNTTGEIVTNRLRQFLEDFINTNKHPSEYKDLSKPGEFKAAFNEFVIAVAKSGHKDFPYMNLRDMDLSNQKFVNCDFRGCSFAGVDFTNTTFIDCKLDGAYFYASDSNDNLAILEGCSLIRTRLDGAWFCSQLHASELNITPDPSILRSCGFMGGYTKGHMITKSEVFAMVNEMSDLSNERVVELNNLIKKPLKNGREIQRECLISADGKDVDLSKACVVQQPDGTIRLYDASKLWTWFKFKPGECPLHYKTEKLKFLSINSLRELVKP
jgi:uncharacterized protein YjbI with pentapeptide repeats